MFFSREIGLQIFTHFAMSISSNAEILDGYLFFHNNYHSYFLFSLYENWLHYGSLHDWAENLTKTGPGVYGH